MQTTPSLCGSSGELNLDHYKYVRGLLPPIPHFIQSLSFSNLNNWECVIYAALLSESDCMKWLTDFQEATKTLWSVDETSPLSNLENKKILWGMVYRCIVENCSGNLEMKILSLTEDDKIKGKQSYPCLINVHFYHNHAFSGNKGKMINSEEDSSFKDQDIPAHLKEQFEGYFLETVPSRPEESNGTRVVILNQTPNSTPQIISNPEMGEVFDVEDVSRKLDVDLEILRNLLKRSGTGCAAVKQFTDQFDLIKNDPDRLENALINFGAISSSHTQQIGLNSGDLSLPTQWTQPAATILENGAVLQPQSSSDTRTEDLFTKTNNLVLTNHHNNNNHTAEEEDEVSKSRKGKKKKLQDITSTSVDPITGKRRKRSRCGTCSGCINRDKTQDCRECRNCLDQKRYGGPGRLKKACVKRSCLVMCSSDGAQQQNQTISLPTTISLPITNGGTLPVGTTTVIAASSSATSGPPAAVLSWPAGAQFTPTFQVQQPVQFTYQPQAFEDQTQQQQGTAVVAAQTVQYTAQPIQLESLTAESVGHQNIT